MLHRGSIYGRGHTTTGKHPYGVRDAAVAVSGQRPTRRQPRATRGTRAAGTAAEGVPPTRARGCAVASAVVCCRLRGRPRCRLHEPPRPGVADGRRLCLWPIPVHSPRGREDVSTQVSAALRALFAAACIPLDSNGAASRPQKVRPTSTSTFIVPRPMRAETSSVSGSARGGYAGCGVRGWWWAYGQHLAHL